jgi:hypothetical protein
MQNKFEAKEEQALLLLDNISKLDYSVAVEVAQKSSIEGISVLIYRNNELIFWSDKSVPLGYLKSDSLNIERLVKLANTTYYQIPRIKGDSILLALIEVASNYPYENKFLQNGISSYFNIKRRIFIFFYIV